MADVNTDSTAVIVENTGIDSSRTTAETRVAGKETESQTRELEEVVEISKTDKLESSDRENASKAPEAAVSKDIDETQTDTLETEPGMGSSKPDIEISDTHLPEKETTLKEVHSNVTDANPRIKETEQEQDKASDAKSGGAKVGETICSDEDKLDEILKIVNDDLVAKNLQAATCSEQSEKGNKASKCDRSIEEKEDATNDSQEGNKKDAKKVVTNVDDKAASQVEVTRLRKDSESATPSEKFEDRSEVGIVGPPTAVSELINEEELRAESALSTDQKMQDHVAEWVENSDKGEALITTEVEEEGNVPNGGPRRKKNIEEKRTRKKRNSDVPTVPTRKSQRIVSNIIKRSIKCLNKMHAMEGAGGNGKKVDAAEKTREEDTSRASPKVPQSQQNGAALPEETAAAATPADRLRAPSIKKEPLGDSEPETASKSHHRASEGSQQKPAAAATTATTATRSFKVDSDGGRKRKSAVAQHSANGSSAPKKLCLEQREQYISSLVGCEKVTADELAARAEQLRAEVQALDELARAKEMEWNEILSMRKLKEEAYLRVERRRQVMGFMEGTGQAADTLPPATLALGPEWESSGNTTPVSKEKCGFESKDDLPDENSDDSPPFKKEKISKSASQRQSTPPKQGGENGRKQPEALSPENRQIGEGRQGAIVDVRSIIADYRLRHPETVPRRGRRMRNSVNVGLGAGGAMVETGHNVDSRPSSTDSCKSNPNAVVDSNNSMSFKDVLVQFAKLSQQQGESVKTPQNYPDVTLHPVAPSPAPQNTPPQQTGSLLHGILTKSQSPRPTTFSPTLARLLTAPERERNAPTAASVPQQTAATQHLLQAYQGSNPVSISDLLSSSKARTEITITPVVNTPVQSHSNNLIHVDDVEEETAVIEDRETRVSAGGRDNRDDRDSPPRCQGCHERAAQFVCAGCGNQWYCSRECQVAAWDEHSEVCSG